MSKEWDFYIRLDCTPPTTTHHNKKIVLTPASKKLTAGGNAKATLADLARKGTGRRARMMDEPRLKAAIDLYTAKLNQTKAALPENLGVRLPLVGPVATRTWFIFQGLGDPRYRYHEEKPDADNMNKTLQDCLVKTGFLKADQQVSVVTPTKLYGPSPCVIVAFKVLPLFARESDLPPIALEV